MSKWVFLCATLFLLGCQHSPAPRGGGVEREEVTSTEVAKAVPVDPSQLAGRCRGDNDSSACVSLARWEINSGKRAALIRARARLTRLCDTRVYEACSVLGTEARLNVAPFNRKRYLVQACEAGVAESCVALGNREERYGNPKRAKAFFESACRLGRSEYCDKKTQASASRTYYREIFLKPIGTEERAFQMSAGPCGKDRGCSFHLMLIEGDMVREKVALPWGSQSGPVERAGNRALAVGDEDDYVGMSVAPYRFSKKLIGVFTRAERGMRNVEHRTDIFIHVDSEIVHVTRRKGDKTPKKSVYVALLEQFSSEAEGVRKMKLLNQDCLKGFQLLSTNYFPQWSGVLLGSLSLKEGDAQARLNEVKACDSTLRGEVKKAY